MAHQLEWTFRNGKKYAAGSPQGRGRDPSKVKETTSSNGLTKYLTILWSDGVLTCDCRGWAIRKKHKDGTPKPRICRHCTESLAVEYADMTPVDDFVPAPTSWLQAKRPQLDFSERQPRRVHIRRRS